MKKHEKLKVANDRDSGQPPALMTLAGYGNHRNYLDSDVDSRQVNSTKKNNHKVSVMSVLSSTTRVAIFFLALTAFHTSTEAAQDGVSTAPTECSIYDAVYKPTKASYPKVPATSEDNGLDFTLTVHQPLPGEKGGSHRSRFFYIDAFDKKTNQKVSTLRMADVCSNGVVVCGIDTTEGQFHPNSEMKDLKVGIGFEPIALDEHLSRVGYASMNAPYLFIVPDTLNQFYFFRRKIGSDQKAFDAAVSEFVKFYTSEKVFPDFGGKDVWVFDHCMKETDH